MDSIKCALLYILYPYIYMSISNMYQQKKKENGLGQTTSRHILCFICLDLKWNCIRTKNCLTSPADGPSFLSDLHYKRVRFLFVESYWKDISPKLNPLRLFEIPPHKVLLCREKNLFVICFLSIWASSDYSTYNNIILKRLKMPTFWSLQKNISQNIPPK